MEYLKYLLSVVVLLCAIPLGYLLKSMTKEELRQGKRYFKLIVQISLILTLILLLLPFDLIMKQTLIFSLIFIVIVSFISWK